MLVRTPEPRDTPDRMEIALATVPYALVTAARIDLDDAKDHPDERCLRLVAEVGGRVAGVAGANLNRFAPPGTAEVTIGVHPDHQGRGVGSALWERVAAHLDAVGATISRTSTNDDDSAAWAARRGFTSGRRNQVSSVDPRDLAEVPLPDGLELLPMNGEDGLRAAYEVDLLIKNDVPTAVPRAHLTYERWRERSLMSDTFDRDCSLVAFLDGTPVSLTMIHVLPPRGINSIAGTHPAHRGKGLATAVKTASLRLAAAKGVTSVVTFNDEENHAMLAVNERLGYRPLCVRHDLVRHS